MSLKFEAANSNNLILTYDGGSERINLNISNIVYIKADGNYVKIYTTIGQCVHVHGALQHVYVALAPSGFIRVHRSYLVNRSWVKRFHIVNRNVTKSDEVAGGGGYIVYSSVAGTARLPIGRSYRKRLRPFVTIC